MANKTYDQLMWDKEFVEKRIKEQLDYILTLNMRWSIGSISYERFILLKSGAIHVKNRFRTQLDNINKLI